MGHCGTFRDIEIVAGATASLPSRRFSGTGDGPLDCQRALPAKRWDASKGRIGASISYRYLRPKLRPKSSRFLIFGPQWLAGPGDRCEKKLPLSDCRVRCVFSGHSRLDCSTGGVRDFGVGIVKLPSYNSSWLEESHRIRGKGLTQLHVVQNNSFAARSSCRLLADPGDLIGEPSWTRSSLPVRIWIISGVRPSRYWPMLESRSRCGEDDAAASAGRGGDERRSRCRARISGWPMRSRRLPARAGLRVGRNWRGMSSSFARLEGTWSFARLEIDGQNIPASALQSSRLLIDGDRFRTESPEANLRRHFQYQCRSNPARDRHRVRRRP